jgi:2',3'-cyclic-nucleotide 2'-phosphodiesterase (5'-nucleotidase family)
MSGTAISRRDFLAISAAVGVTIMLPGGLSAVVKGTKTFTILHTNDMHSSFIGMGSASDYIPFVLNLMVAQLLKIDGHPVQFQLGGRYYAEKPNGGPNWGLRFAVTFLFPK